MPCFAKGLAQLSPRMLFRISGWQPHLHSTICFLYTLSESRLPFAVQPAHSGQTIRTSYRKQANQRAARQSLSVQGMATAYASKHDDELFRLRWMVFRSWHFCLTKILPSQERKPLDTQNRSLLCQNPAICFLSNYLASSTRVCFYCSGSRCRPINQCWARSLE